LSTSIFQTLSSQQFKEYVTVTTGVRQVPTTDMQVTSIRLEQELKEQLKKLAGAQGYQALIREILWQYVQQYGESEQPQIDRSEIRATIPATAHTLEYCVISGKSIQPQEDMCLGLTLDGHFVPLAKEFC
jgi:predicted DNA binding CopG/RHH family protein